MEAKYRTGLQRFLSKYKNYYAKRIELDEIEQIGYEAAHPSTFKGLETEVSNEL